MPDFKQKYNFSGLAVHKLSLYKHKCNKLH